MIATTTMPIKVVAARAPEAVAAVVASAEPLPNAVVEAAAAAAMARLQAQARADVDLVKASVRVIDKAFYDAGQALVRLKRPHAYDLTREKALAVVRLCRMAPENELRTARGAATSPTKSADTPPPDADPAAWLEQLLRDAGLEGARVKLKRPKKSEAMLGKVLGKASLGKTVLGRTTFGRSMLGKVSLGKAVLGIDGIAVDEIEAFCAAIAGRRA